jgi:hypothetical protein
MSSSVPHFIKNSKINFKIKIHGRPWTIRTGSKCLDKKSLGECDYSTQTITLRRKPLNDYGIELLAHELAHAFFPSAKEDTVNKFGMAMSTAVFKMCSQVGLHVSAPNFEEHL